MRLTTAAEGRAYIVGHDATPDIEDETLRMLASHDKDSCKAIGFCALVCDVLDRGRT